LQSGLIPIVSQGEPYEILLGDGLDRINKDGDLDVAVRTRGSGKV
jgi:hypothetical protein